MLAVLLVLSIGTVIYAVTFFVQLDAGRVVTGPFVILTGSWLCSSLIVVDGMSRWGLAFAGQNNRDVLSGDASSGIEMALWGVGDVVRAANPLDDSWAKSRTVWKIRPGDESRVWEALVEYLANCWAPFLSCISRCLTTFFCFQRRGTRAQTTFSLHTERSLSGSWQCCSQDALSAAILPSGHFILQTLDSGNLITRTHAHHGNNLA